MKVEAHNIEIGSFYLVKHKGRLVNVCVMDKKTGFWMVEQLDDHTRFSVVTRDFEARIEQQESGCWAKVGNATEADNKPDLKVVHPTDEPDDPAPGPKRRKAPVRKAPGRRKVAKREAVTEDASTEQVAESRRRKTVRKRKKTASWPEVTVHLRKRGTKGSAACGLSEAAHVSAGPGINCQECLKLKTSR